MLQYEQLAVRLDTRLEKHIIQLPPETRREVTQRVFQRLEVLSSQDFGQKNNYVFTHLRDAFFARNLLEQARDEKYRVTNVVDGDTVDVSDGENTFRVRLIGVDTPERGECYFHEARDLLESLILGREIILTKDSTQDERDIYGRELRYIFLPDGLLVNAWIVRQ